MLTLTKGNEYLPPTAHSCSYKIEKYETEITYKEERLIQSHRIPHMHLVTLDAHKLSTMLLVVSEVKSILFFEMKSLHYQSGVRMRLQEAFHYKFKGSELTLPVGSVVITSGDAATTKVGHISSVCDVRDNMVSQGLSGTFNRKSHISGTYHQSGSAGEDSHMHMLCVAYGS
jgi:hypothetical protein